MNNFQDILLFPFRDQHSRAQFLIACAVMLAAFFIPILPTLVLMGYSVKIMRQIIIEKKPPSLPAWQGSDWSEMLLDGLRLYGAQFVLMLPLFILMGCGMISMFGGSLGISALADESTSAVAPIGMLLMMIGFLFFGLFSVLSIPYSVVLYGMLPHVAVKGSFQAAFEFNEWFPIFRKALGQFILGYVIIMAVSFVFAMIIQIAMITIILICIVPFIMIPFAAYQMLVMNAFFAQAYAFGREALQTT